MPEQFVQVIFMEPNHWACLTNIFRSSTCNSCTQAVNLFDFLHTGPDEQGSIVRSNLVPFLSPNGPTIALNVMCRFRMVVHRTVLSSHWPWPLS